MYTKVSKTTGVSDFLLKKKKKHGYEAISVECAFISAYIFYYIFWYTNHMLKANISMHNIKTKLSNEYCLTLKTYVMLQILTCLLASIVWKSNFHYKTNSIMCEIRCICIRLV